MLRQFLAGILCLVLLLVFLLFSVPFYFYRRFVIQLASRTRKDFGKILSLVDSLTDDETSSNIPNNALAFVVMLEEKQLELPELQKLFKENVLNAKLVQNGKLRYPELQQCLTSFMGYRFWKQVENFRIEDHIVEELHDQVGSLENLSLLHENLLNTSFPPDKSPWELILLHDRKNQSSILGFRISHAMCDAKSVLKLLVQCLGQKPVLKTAREQQLPRINPLYSTLRFIPLLISSLDTNLKGYWHPWMPTLLLKRSLHLVSLSAPLSLQDIKTIAKNQGVTGSSVIIALITGAIHNLADPNLHTFSPSWYALPKENHPEVLANHTHIAVLKLPTNQVCPLKRLEICGKDFNHVKKTQPEKMLVRVAQVAKVLGGPLRRMIVKLTLPSPISITNVAGELEGFSVGGKPVSHFSFSAGLSDSIAAVQFAAFSYKQHIHISVTARKSVLSRETVQRLAVGVQTELNVLMGLNQKQIFSENEFVV